MKDEQKQQLTYLNVKKYIEIRLKSVFSHIYFKKYRYLDE